PPHPDPLPPAGGEGEKQSDPREEEMFGGGSQPPAAEAAPPAPKAELGRFAEHLQVGGQLYLRAQVLGAEDVAPGDWTLSSPNLVDVWADTRPNDRVRGFLLVRGFHDPTGGGTALLRAGTTNEAALGLSGETDVVLDQLWVNFDLGRRAFVTAGKQHVKWGVGRFWNPTDFLHPVRRDPLAPFDVRTGVTMLKVHVPWEARGWNLYGVALVEDAAGEGPVQRMGGIGGGGRAELVVGLAELGLDALVQDGNRPRFGVDLSAGVFELDVYGEAALRHGTDAWRVRRAATATGFEAFRPEGFTPSVVAGASWSRNYSDEDAFTVGLEWFWQDSGYEDEELYPALLAAEGAQTLPAQEREALGVPAGAFFTPFYLGRQYAGVFLLLPGPGRWNDGNVTLSALGNLSDRSAIARLDVSVLALTYLRFETFVQGHLGERGGEFRFAGTFAAPGLPQPVAIPAPTVDFGVALRVTL
ncbi:MAG TPA: hypothetical protein VD838_06180, partial [Anaeromyxobacteraceae bacterium]|nr:hypothetical protein [Anaeromyxobacteraceae bacterium]